SWLEREPSSANASSFTASNTPELLKRYSVVSKELLITSLSTSRSSCPWPEMRNRSMSEPPPPVRTALRCGTREDRRLSQAPGVWKHLGESNERSLGDFCGGVRRR